MCVVCVCVGMWIWEKKLWKVNKIYDYFNFKHTLIFNSGSEKIIKKKEALYCIWYKDKDYDYFYHHEQKRWYELETSK